MNAFRHTIPPLKKLREVIENGDISMVLLLAGLGLILWAGFGIFVTTEEIEQYARMFPFGNVGFWIINYIICGLAMWWLVAYQYPPTLSLLVGTWCSIVWSWSVLGRLANIDSFHTGNATSIIYVIVGLLIIQRTSRLRK